MCRLYSHSKSAYLPQIRAPIPTGIFRPTGVLISATSAAIGYPIRVWIFSIVPMPKVRSAEVILSQLLLYSTFLPTGRILQRLRLLQGMCFRDRTDTRDSGQTLTLPCTSHTICNDFSNIPPAVEQWSNSSSRSPSPPEYKAILNALPPFSRVKDVWPAFPSNLSTLSQRNTGASAIPSKPNVITKKNEMRCRVFSQVLASRMQPWRMRPRWRCCFVFVGNLSQLGSLSSGTTLGFSIAAGGATRVPILFVGGPPVYTAQHVTIVILCNTSVFFFQVSFWVDSEL